MSTAWERWQASKTSTGETWDEAKQRAMEEYTAAQKSGVVPHAADKAKQVISAMFARDTFCVTRADYILHT